MESNLTIVVHAGFKVETSEIEAFEQLVAELTARAAGEPGTLTFRFFRGEPGAYAAVEEYADPDFMRAHQEANRDLLMRIDECVADVRLELHGSVGPSMREWAQRVSRVVLYEDQL